jgi:lipoyl synthase
MLPTHLKKRLPKGPQPNHTRALLAELRLATICDEARCPNRVECYAHGTATFLIMGDTCTRRCGFCAVKTGRPSPLDSSEPARVGEAVRRMGLRHAVVTSVDRDDLPDGGAAHFVETIHAIRAASPGTLVEVLTPDFRGDLAAVGTVAAAEPDVFNHNVETVPRLYPTVRHRSDFERSMRVLHHAKKHRPAMWTKTGLMVGLGETPEEVIGVLGAARKALVDFVTIGQYLQPSAGNLAVAEYVEPALFERFAEEGRRLGFAHVFSAPFVRSSYLADMAVLESNKALAPAPPLA